MITILSIDNDVELIQTVIFFIKNIMTYRMQNNFLMMSTKKQILIL